MILFNHLTIGSLIRTYPLLSTWTKKYHGKSIYYLSASKITIKFVKLILLFNKINIQKAFWDYGSLVTDDRVNLGLMIKYHKKNPICKAIELSAKENILVDEKEASHLIQYLIKILSNETWPYHNRNLKDTLLTIHAVALNSQNKLSEKKGLIIFHKIPWIKYIEEYANKQNVDIYVTNISLKLSIKEFIKKNIFFKYIYALRKSCINPSYSKNLNALSTTNKNVIAIDTIIQMINPIEFWFESGLRTSDILLTANMIKPIPHQINSLIDAGFKYVHKTQYISFIDYINSNIATNIYGSKKIISLEEKYVRDTVIDCIREINIWKVFFIRTNSKVYVSHYKWDRAHIPANYAIKDIGGISALLQTSYYCFPAAHEAIMTDIYFTFTNKNVSIEEHSGSKIQYVVVTGFINDYKYSKDDTKADNLRDKLYKSGAKKIISFFDQGYYEDGRFNYDYEVTMSDYEFWLKKVISDRWLGLIIKAKKPKNIKDDFKKISSLFTEASETGRFYMSMESDPYHVKNFQESLAVSALASDLAIHSSLSSASAGIEAALSGVPTLYYDKENWVSSQLYNLGKGNVIFTDWDDMWSSIKNYFFSKSNNQLGYWGNYMNEIDPFRDGKARYRMGNYLKWLKEGFDHGLDRETIMADAADLYAKKWGDDKVIHLSDKRA
jgi:hypothetical protein